MAGIGIMMVEGGRLESKETQSSREEMGHRVRTANDVLDMVFLQDLVAGDLDLLREIITLYLSGLPQRMSQIKEAVAAGQARDLERAAHGLKGASGNFQARHVIEAARRLEAMGHQGDLAWAGETLNILEKEVERVRSFLTRVLEAPLVP
ncbi:MAG: Hpt domain-containing protein [Thermodesulfobacteriota bacterium]